MGHASVKATEIYTHVLHAMAGKARSPLDGSPLGQFPGTSTFQFTPVPDHASQYPKPLPHQQSPEDRPTNRGFAARYRQYSGRDIFIGPKKGAFIVSLSLIP